MNLLKFGKIAAFACFLLTIVSCTQSYEWPGWRGPNRDAKVEGFKTPSTWPKSLKKEWSQRVGLSNSSPVIVKNKLFLHVKQENNEVVICIDEKTGDLIWSTILNTAPEVTGGAKDHPGPRSTPAVANNKVFLLGAGGVLSCVNSDNGKIIWQNNNYTEVPQFYTAMSPLVIGNLCFVHLGGHDNGEIINFNADNGEIIWELKGESCTYSSPVVMNFGKDEVLVFQTETDLIGISKKGEKLWKIPTPPERRFYNSSTPVIDGQNVIVAGQGLGTKSFKIEKSGNEYSYSENWSNPDFGVSFNTPVLKDGFLYGNEARLGKLFCLNTATGETCWADTTRHNRFASTLDLGETILSLPASAEMLLFKPDAEKYTESAVYKMAETEIYAHPLIVGNKIFIKDEENLTCWLLE